MSKNITIQEGGVARQITANKLKTNLVGGGTCLWVPEDETQLGTKHISENGTFKANDDGYYGYSEVTVSGIGTATGTGPDGETHQYTEDGEGGITDTLLPSSISVVTPPTITTYEDGATIDFSGMVVKGYLKSGDLWTDSDHPDGVIPISELTLPVTIADIDGVSGQTASSPIVSGEIPCGPSGLVVYGPTGSTADTHYTISCDAVLWEQYANNGVRYFYASANPNAVCQMHFSLPDGQSEDYTAIMRHAYEYDGKTVYYGTGTYGVSNRIIKSVSPDATEIYNSNSPDSIAWTIIYGTITPGGQVIPVQYMIGIDTLESSFSITVNPSTPNMDGEENGNASSTIPWEIP